jgi:hypothetical protein
MSYLKQVWRLFDYSALDEQIEKFRSLADAYKKDNMAYYGEYLSGILFTDGHPDETSGTPK